MIKDFEKYNALALAGWKLLRFTPQQVRSGYAGDVVQQFFMARGI